MDEGFDAHFLPSVKSSVLDSYLEKGWYRMAMLMFTTNELTVAAVQHKVYWLRYHVPAVKLKKAHLRLLQTNSGFTHACRLFQLTPEIEDLHRRYHAGISFETPATLQEILFDTERSIFDSYVMELRFNNILVGAGIFDKGDNSISGIKIIYDPEWKRKSPGKHIILLTYLYCAEQQIEWYYPGYYSPTYNKFDYKLFLDKAATEVFLPAEQVWVPYEEFAGTLNCAN